MVDPMTNDELDAAVLATVRSMGRPSHAMLCKRMGVPDEAITRSVCRLESTGRIFRQVCIVSADEVTK